jgi:hypothetical protein
VEIGKEIIAPVLASSQAKSECGRNLLDIPAGAPKIEHRHLPLQGHTMPRDSDDDDDRPRRRRPRDDDDDRPRKRRPRDDENEDDRPRTRRKAYDEDDDDTVRRRRRKSRPVKKQLNVVGLISLVIGGLGLVSSFICCIASYSLIPSGIGLIVGFVGLIVAQRSDGRQTPALAITGMSVSFVAVLIGIGWLVAGKQIQKKFDKDFKEVEEQVAREEAKRKDDLAKAATEVKNAQPGTVTRVDAVLFFNAYANDDSRQADRTYKNKILEVTGVFHEVDFTDDEVIIVHLRAGPQFERVYCHFAKDPNIRNQLAKLKPGQPVVIRGKCLGGDSTIEACILIQ